MRNQFWLPLVCSPSQLWRRGRSQDRRHSGRQGAGGEGGGGKAWATPKTPWGHPDISGTGRATARSAFRWRGPISSPAASN